MWVCFPLSSLLLLPFFFVVPHLAVALQWLSFNIRPRREYYLLYRVSTRGDIPQGNSDDENTSGGG
ncbi:uncharacterized protein BP01DRAFT_93723 [Aspergillus saccharolyticus JOP 1030-1]|uniref:Uncharacterized protein n=1 Tax=Aspergillus saccharolyticus JOP 1030-1 TaxID=1450539 RepID=A0A318Z8Y8_9EURO|nr:hypothetical protein BP01DRAFT_93723 [Aspergillus saccharolyticus JOP 1030-1]PYH43831.1 hypothetical protein BP01DRAFT_93723 [Aspergillus saccharolyticus JOP 1030-1]